MTVPWNGPLSFSLLKRIAPEGGGSPAHFLEACKRELREPQRGTIVGTLVHRQTLGGPEPIIWEGERKGKIWECVTMIARGLPFVVCPLEKRSTKAWKAFKEDHPNEEIFLASEHEEAWEVGEQARDEKRSIVTRSEANIAAACVSAVRSAHHNQVAREWLFSTGARYEVPVGFELNGFEMHTRGIDVLHEGAHHFPPAVVELKTGPSIPEVAAWQARKSLHWEQLATYDHAARQRLDVRAQHWGIVSVETVRPYCATVLEIPQIGLADALRRVLAWTDTLHECIRKNEWPGHAIKAVMVDVKIDLVGLDNLPTFTEPEQTEDGDAAQ